MDLFRVFPWDPSARPHAKGGALYAPAGQGAGRVDNPSRYRVLYAADRPEAAVAERLGRHPIWDTRLLDVMAAPGDALGLAHLRMSAPVLDLDSPAPLAERGLIPSAVATRDRARTQEWAARIFDERTWSGVRWWGHYEATWSTFGLWRTTGIRITSIEPLTLQHPALFQAAEHLARPVDG